MNISTEECYYLALQVKNWNSWFDIMYAYYVEVPMILISGSNFHFIPPVQFLEIFQFFCIRIFRTLVTICANIHTYDLVLT